MGSASRRGHFALSGLSFIKILYPCRKRREPQSPGSYRATYNALSPPPRQGLSHARSPRGCFFVRTQRVVFFSFVRSFVRTTVTEEESRKGLVTLYLGKDGNPLRRTKGRGRQRKFALPLERKKEIKVSCFSSNPKKTSVKLGKKKYEKRDIGSLTITELY